jgi:hypothetical protein
METADIVRLAPRVLAGVSLLLVIFNDVMSVVNRSAQLEVNARAQFINQTVQLGRLEQAIVRAAATAAVNNKDTQLGNLLTSNGIRYQAPAASGTVGGAAAPTPAGGRKP